MSSISHDGVIYQSRSELVRKLLKDKKYRKTAIARCARVTPQTVESIYKDLVFRKKIDDYYPRFKELLKEKRLSKKKNNNDENVLISNPIN